MPPKILVVDDDPSISLIFEHVYQELGIDLLSANTAKSAYALAQKEKLDAVFIDVVLPDDDGLSLLSELRTICPESTLVVMTGNRDSQTAISAMQLGAFDFLVKPLAVDSIRKVTAQALEVHRLTIESIDFELDDDSHPHASLIGSCQEMQEVYKSIGRVANQNLSVLIRGESGTGKELVARAIYQYSKRSSKPFVALNCAAIPSALLESELFGHEKGAFTGADSRRIGKIEQCNGGTLFLDEIGDMDILLQSKLLRVLQEKQFERVGGNQTLQSDVRIIAATHRDLEKMCENREFREDLMYRLNGYTILLPPLRDRKDDIEILIDFFRKRSNKELGKSIKRVTEETMAILKRYDWPGNIRQLQNVVHQSILTASGPVLIPEFLPKLDSALDSTALKNGSYSSNENQTVSQESETIEQLIESIENRCGSGNLFDNVVNTIERRLLLRTLKQTKGNQSEAATQLGISRTTLRSKIEKLDIKSDFF